jgi:hypothetical protein
MHMILGHSQTVRAGSRGYNRGLFASHWFLSSWRPHHAISANSGISIAWQELFAIVVAAALWGPAWHGKRILFNCDNEGVVQALRKGTSPKRRIMALIRALLALAWEHNFDFSARHVSGCLNDLADPLSRLQVDLFRQRAAAQNLVVDAQATAVPGWLLRL